MQSHLAKNTLIGFVRTTLIGGLLFLVPLAATVVVLAKTLHFVAHILRPVEQVLPTRTIVGVAVVDILAVVGLLALGFAAGIFAQTLAGKRISHVIEELILGKIPGYTLLRGIVGNPEKTGGDSKLKVVLATIDDTWLIAFLVEGLPDGTLVVFVPSAPTPTVGNLYLMTEQQVKRWDVPVSTAIKCIMRLGVGWGELMRQQQTQQH